MFRVAKAAVRKAPGGLMAELAKTLEIRTSPHVLSGYSVDTIMFNVVLALLPVDGLRGLRLRPRRRCCALGDGGRLLPR